jgi:hypothetical protein
VRVTVLIKPLDVADGQTIYFSNRTAGISRHGRGSKPFLVVQDFFRRSGVATMTVRELFDFVTDPTLADNKVDEYLDEVRTCGL